MMESFNSNFKREELYRHEYLSEKKFRKLIDEYIKKYNEKRPHDSDSQHHPPCRACMEFSYARKRALVLQGLFGAGNRIQHQNKQSLFNKLQEIMTICSYIRLGRNDL